MKTLVIDNYDSFTYNLVHLLAEVNHSMPVIVRNDETSWEHLCRMRFDNIVISPGPGHPANSTDMGVSRAAIRHSKVPVLGVCLGHQAIGLECGASVVHVPELIHGRTSAINHGGEGLFEGVPSPTAVARYHSYVIVDPVPSSLFVTARSEDGLVMAVAHATRALWGVQFHPESIITDCGRKIIENFRDMTRAAA